MESIKSTHQTNTEARRIIFFDGECVFCSHWTDFLLRVLKNRKSKNSYYKFQLATLQGKTAKAVFVTPGHKHLIQSPFKTLVLRERLAGTVNDSAYYTESDAVFKIFSNLEFPWSMITVFHIFPRFILDFVYHIVAKNRFLVFGRRKFCRMPTPEENQWFLD